VRPRSGFDHTQGLTLKTDRAVDQLGERLVHQADAKFDPARPCGLSLHDRPLAN
jgi:hypothetical protein